jgi:hypothetical protein
MLNTMPMTLGLVVAVFATLVVAAEARNFSLPTVFAHGKIVACWLMEGVALMVLRECDFEAYFGLSPDALNS